MQADSDLDRAINYFQNNPDKLEFYITSSNYISNETFQRWAVERNQQLKYKTERRHLVTSYVTPAGRAQALHSLGAWANNPKRLVYELGSTCAQICRCSKFDVLIPIVKSVKKRRSTVSESTVTSENDENGEVGSMWRKLELVNGQVVEKPLKANRRGARCVQKLIDCNERCLAELHLYSDINDRDAQYMNILSNWGSSMIYYAAQANKVEAYNKRPAKVQQYKTLVDFLLDVVKSIFQDMNTMDSVILKIMHFAQRLVEADRASLFLVDSKKRELYAQMFDIGVDKPEQSDDQSQRVEIKFPIDKGIAGYVAMKGQGLNIMDAYRDHRFNPEVDQRTGYKTNTILCMPIFMRGHVIGVVQMVNKVNGTFTSEDEDNFETFAVFCGLALHHAKLYDKIRRSEQKYRVALEVLAYHSVCNTDEVNKVKNLRIQEPVPELDSFAFNGYQLKDIEKPLYAVYMFKTLFSDIIQIDTDDLIRFFLTVRKNYRPVPYHNWTHGWTVAHAMFVFLRKTKIFTPHEKLSLFVAAICHDLDHRGKNNEYMKTMSTPLASIYTTSVMEHHHFNQTVAILQHDGHNVLRSLQPADYKKVLGLIKQHILATDLALFFPNRGKLEKMVEKKEFSWDNPDHRLLAQALLMTSCDLVATAKPWKVQTDTVRVIFEEFYEQGDAERLNGRSPQAMMDRSRAMELPQSQVQFISSICVPCYNTISMVIPEAHELKERSEFNLKKWEEVAAEFAENPANGTSQHDT
ncbi:unnamed protein product [Bursaphelenchus okinawaensis]|uniref:Phosphodiesterase n=1 Tax=Bursaphelenchus okinawaensis TaxID=465554 RepID=A0A811JQ22_9BILA|nr:unnamed protein product [Bursaphelenchus okinawaensis]CAG9077531.1 unnamed protein product [Bursaphelenchus okinawaensis]